MPSRFWRASGNALLPSPALANTGGAYTPASEAGNNLWIVPDAAHTFTDAGTTNVSVSGTDTAQQVNDQSVAARNLSQATSASRPIWDTVSSKPCLHFDGSNDFMATAANAAWVDGTGQFWVAVSLTTLVAAGYTWASIAGTSPAEILRTTIASDASYNATSFDNTNASSVTAWGSGAAINTPMTLIVQVTPTLATIYKNGTGAATIALTGTRQTALAKLFLGAQSPGTSSFLNANVFGIAAGSGVLGSLANMHTYMAGLHP